MSCARLASTTGPEVVRGCVRAGAAFGADDWAWERADINAPPAKTSDARNTLVISDSPDFFLNM
jgi:hypothetical protein